MAGAVQDKQPIVTGLVEDLIARIGCMKKDPVEAGHTTIQYITVHRGRTAGCHGYLRGLPTLGVKYAARAIPSCLTYFLPFQDLLEDRLINPRTWTQYRLSRFQSAAE